MIILASSLFSRRELRRYIWQMSATSEMVDDETNTEPLPCDSTPYYKFSCTIEKTTHITDIRDVSIVNASISQRRLKIKKR